MRNVIKLTESQLKKMVKDTVNEQATKNYFAVYEKAENIKLKPTNDSNEMLDDSGSGLDLYIWNNGRVMSVDKADSTHKLMGKMEILSDNSYKLIWTNGYTYDSATDALTKTAVNSVAKPEINTANCANQLIDITNGKVLKFGCKTQGVKELQTLLDVVGKDGVPTGYFGNKTKQAVIDFQKKNKLKKIEGIVGPETYKALTPNAVPAPAKDLKEGFDDENDSENANEYLNSLFNTEDDYDGEPYRGDEEGFSNKMRQNQINKKIRLGDTNIGGGHYITDRKKDRENEKRRYAGLEPLRNDLQPEPYSPIKSDDLPLDKYLEKKKMRNLDEEDINDDNFNDYLDSLFVKD
jgi:peptidoglycan hydrolase-like protein with peptidoglycan-binding domain